MKLYTSAGVNPRVVAMFLKERNADLPSVHINNEDAENRQQAYLTVNPNGTTPALEISDGVYISETVAICEYLDEVLPGKSLIGDNPVERARTRMWASRVDLYLCEPIGNLIRYGKAAEIFRDRMPINPEAVPGLERKINHRLTWLDDQMRLDDFFSEGAPVTVAHLKLYCFLDLHRSMQSETFAEYPAVANWLSTMSRRRSAMATAP